MKIFKYSHPRENAWRKTTVEAKDSAGPDIGEMVDSRGRAMKKEKKKKVKKLHHA